MAANTLPQLRWPCAACTPLVSPPTPRLTLRAVRLPLSAAHIARVQRWASTRRYAGAGPSYMSFWPSTVMW